MKDLIRALSGKTALYIVMALAAVSSVLEIVTAVRNGTSIDWPGMSILWVALSGWAVCLESSEKKNKE